MSEVEHLLERLRREGGIRVRVEALRAQAVRAVRMLESRLVGTLSGDSLRGLVSLVPWENGRFYGANVRGGERFGIDTYLPFGEAGTLCIGRHGNLVMAGVDGDGMGPDRVHVRGAKDKDLRIEDLELVVGAVREALRRHLEALPAAERRYERVRRVAECVEEAFGRVA